MSDAERMQRITESMDRVADELEDRARELRKFAEVLKSDAAAKAAEGGMTLGEWFYAGSNAIGALHESVRQVRIDSATKLVYETAYSVAMGDHHHSERAL